MEPKYKQYSAQIEPIAERKMSFTISTAAVDRDGDTIDPAGWDTGSFKGNPVVLWAHDYTQPPVGKATNIVATKDGLKADVEFTPQGMNPFADMIHDMVKGGFLNATSVGFRGKEFEKAKDRQYGYDFKSQELLEFSIVPVPSNPEALVVRGPQLVQAKAYAKAVKEWAESLEPVAHKALRKAGYESILASCKEEAISAFAEEYDKETDGGKKELRKADLDALIELHGLKDYYGADIIPYNSAESMHNDMLSANANAKMAMSQLEGCGMDSTKAIDPVQADALKQAHAAASRAASYSASAARKAHEHMLASKQPEKIEQKAESMEISTDVIDIKAADDIINWDEFNASIPKEISFTSEEVSQVLVEAFRASLKEVAAAQARQAVNKMAGRLD